MSTYGILEGGILIAQFATPMTLRSNKPVFGSDTLSLSRRPVSRTPQRWELETRLVPLSFGAEELFVNLVVNGHHDPMFITAPQNYGAEQRLVASLTTPTAQGFVNTSIITVSGNTGLLPKGTFVKFATMDKVYMLKSDRQGNGAVGIYPALRADLSAGTAFQYKTDVVMVCYYDAETVSGMTYVDGILMDVGTVRLVERV
jgi:hypothetical protein